MPPASPVPGWSSGEVCTLTMATRRTASSSISCTSSPLAGACRRHTTPATCNQARGVRIPERCSERRVLLLALPRHGEAGAETDERAEHGVDEVGVSRGAVDQAEDRPDQR